MRLHPRLLLFAAAIAAALLGSLPALAQEQIYIPPFVSSTTGPIEGPVTEAGLEGSIEVLGFQHELSRPINDKSGLFTGPTQHHVVTVTKALDRASPLLVDSLTKSGVFNMTILFFRPGADGSRDAVFAILLEEARVSGVRHKKVNAPQSTTLETVSFTYDKMTWESVPEGVLAFDSWKQTRRSK